MGHISPTPATAGALGEWVMGRRWGALALAVALVAVLAPRAMATSKDVLGLYVSADPNGEGCPAPASADQTRTGNIDTALTYLRSLVNHDTSTLRVAVDAKRWEEGGKNADSAKQLCQGNQGPVTIEDAVLSMRQMKWSVVEHHEAEDGNPAYDDAIAWYYLDSPTSPTYIAERFRVQGGLIEEIEAIFYVDTTGLVVGPESLASKPESQEQRVFDSDQGPAGFYAPVNNRGDITVPASAGVGRVRNAAQAYLDALVDHTKASAIPFAPEVKALVNRRDKSGSGDALRAYIGSDANRIGAPMVHLDQHPLIYVEGDSAVAMYMVGSLAQDAVGLGTVVGLRDLWVATRFKVVNGQITEVETVCNGSEFCGFSS
jgi:hypothetical protein